MKWLNDRPSSETETRRVHLALISHWMFSLPVTCRNRRSIKALRAHDPASASHPRRIWKYSFPCSFHSNFSGLFPSEGFASSCLRTFGPALQACPTSEQAPPLFKSLSLPCHFWRKPFLSFPSLSSSIPVIYFHCPLSFSELRHTRK